MVTLTKMNRCNTKTIVQLVSLIILILLSIPSLKPAQAMGTTYFGGRITFTISCTCDSGKFMTVVDDYASNKTLKLGFNISELKTLFYRNYNPFSPGNYLLGSYSKSSETCRIGYGIYCISITMDGKFNNQPGTGTS